MGGSPDTVVVGAGVVGACCAYYATLAGLTVTVVERAAVAGGTTGAGEGNLLVSDKGPGPELDLALLSIRRWRELVDELGGGFEYEPKGGLVVAPTAKALEGLLALAEAQGAAGIDADPVAAAELPAHEPHLTPGLNGGVRYPQDAQVQPMLATARLLAAARRHGAQVLTGLAVTGVSRGHDGRVTAVRTAAGDLPTATVVNAAGVWGGEVARLAGAEVPVQPRRGVVLVTEPLPRLIRHKVYTADYVGGVASAGEGMESSPVVESAQSGTVLIGASREFVGFSRTLSVPVLRRLAAQAVGLFPFLGRVRAIRAYAGFRPYCPDHLPVIGPDPRVPGLLHAFGHEGAGIGLAPATGHAVAQILTGTEPGLDLTPFRPQRFSDDPSTSDDVEPVS